MNLRIRRLAAFVLGTFALTTTARAGDPMIEALTAIPEDAIGFVCIPSLEQLDADYRQAIVDLGLQDQIPPMAQSLLMTVKMVPMFMTVDTKRPVILVAMPAKTLPELGKSTALILPTADAKPILQGLMAESNEDGTWKVNVFGTPMIAATGAEKLVLASTPDIAKRVAGNKKSYASKLTQEQKSFLKKLDFAVWVEAPPLIQMFRPQIDGLIMMSLMSNMGQGVMGEKAARAQKEQLDTYLDGMAGLGLGIALNRVGLDLRFAMTAKQGSELSKQLATGTTRGPLLDGLPSNDFLFAIGQVIDPNQTRDTTQNLDPLFSMLQTKNALNPEKLDELKKTVKEWVVLFTGVRASFHLLPEGADGVFGATVVVKTTDSRKWMNLLNRIVDLGRGLLEIPDSQKDFRNFVDALSFKKDAEVLGNVKFTHWKMNPSKLDESVDQTEIAKMKKLVGQDGLLVRIGAVDDKTVVFSFGGGKAHAKEIIEMARSDRNVVGESAGVKKVNAELPANKSVAMYFAIDRIVTLVKRVNKTLGEENEIPFDVPTVDAPIAFVGSSARGWTRVDFYVPMDLGEAAVKIALEMRAHRQAEANKAANNEGQAGSNAPE